MMRRVRKQTGNMIAMIAGTLIVMAALIFFGLWYTQHSLNGTSHRSSIDSAALAAASAIGRIAVNTPEFGWVSLTGSAPIGKAPVQASDGWNSRIHSFNELMATNRVDTIIANQIGDVNLQRMVQDDNTRLQAVATELANTIKLALVPGGDPSAIDVSGAKVTPYDDALAMYLSNPTLASAYVPGSFKLTLGSVDQGIRTAVNLPTPAAKAAVAAADQIDNKYRSDRDIAVGSSHFVFAGVSDQASLCTNQKFVTSVAGLPYQVPSAIQVYAEQNFKEAGGRTDKQKFTSVATAGGVFVAPADGQLRVSFPDGRPPEITCIRDIWNYGGLGTPAALYTSDLSDFPTNGAAQLQTCSKWNSPTVTWGSPPSGSDVARLCFYDWLRQCGSKSDIDDITAMVDDKFQNINPAKELWVTQDSASNIVTVKKVPTGSIHQFDENDQGQYEYEWKRMTPEPYYPVAQAQLYGEVLNVNFPQTATDGSWDSSKVIPIKASSGIINMQATPVWDVYFRDYVRDRGATTCGAHAGEPLAYARDYGVGGAAAGGGYPPPMGNGAPPSLSQQTDFALSTTPKPRYKAYSSPPGVDKPRPTYTVDGIDCEIRFRRQMQIGDFPPFTIGYKGVTLDPGTQIDPSDGLKIGPGPKGGTGSGGKGSKGGGGRGGGRGGGMSGGSGGGGSRGKGHGGHGGS